MREMVVEDLTADAVSRDDEHEQQRRGTRQLLLARGCVFVAAYAVSAILARKLGATEYGIYGVVMSQLLWLEMLATAGVPAASAKLMADGRNDVGEVERSARALLFGLSIPLLVVCWLVAPQVASLMRIPYGEVLFRIAILDLPFAALYASYDGILHGHRRFLVVAITHAVYGLTRLIGIIALVGFGLSIERAIVVSVLSTVVVCLVLAVYYRPRGLRPRCRIMRQVAALGAPMALMLISSTVLLNLDLWCLKSLWDGPGAVVGYYVAAATLARALIVVPAAQAGVLFASVAWAIGSGHTARAQQHVQEATRFALIVAVPTCVILGVDAPEVLSLLFSSAYADGYHFLRLLLIGFGLFALLDAFSASLMAAGRHWIAAGTLILTVPIVWLSTFLLIPLIGPIGAATSMLFGVAVDTALLGAVVHRHLGSPIRSSTLVRVLVAAAVVGLVSVVFQVHGPWLLVKLAMLGALYLAVLRALGEITGTDFRVAVKPGGVA